MIECLNHDGLVVEYAEIRDPDRWTPDLPVIPLARAQALIAVRIGAVRLIDNLRLDQ
jgi:pantothenate synthetase